MFRFALTLSLRIRGSGACTGEVTGSVASASVFLSNLQSVCALLELWLAPHVGALTDALGRRPPLLVLSALLTLSRLLMVPPCGGQTG